MGCSMILSDPHFYFLGRKDFSLRHYLCPSKHLSITSKTKAANEIINAKDLGSGKIKNKNK